MKFGKCLSASAQELPEDWRQHVVHYSHLKKCINRIVAELEEIGLASLAAGYSDESIDSTQPLKLIYSFIGTVKRFKSFPRLMNSKALRKPNLIIPSGTSITQLIRAQPLALNITLPTDSEFFGNLSGSINGLTKFELDMKEACSGKIVKLASLISHTASPYSKDIIWMVNNRVWQKPQTVEKTREQYQWFVQEITRLSLAKKFRTRDSSKALEQFMMLNRDLLSIMQFHELNQTAIRKIIKKHDKRTHLSAKSWFVDLMAPSLLFKGNLSKALLSALHSELLIIIPQPDDYQCPICLSISWKPIRLKCGHVFCVQCMIGAQRRKIHDCPLCRAPDSVTEANTGNLDVPRMNFMKLYFPREIKAKQKEIDYEQAKEDVKVIGINSDMDGGCVIM
ncbi:hypothetical protein K493DRAFT_207875 [Basidiobolus meristosporus CBS 931.73]|uniref:SPX-domain-containing protein n=1 Tax=Basidiobolus meristosporus CBS 931.73 TaxID=1314790 RepID=A0A1Y1YXU9_9FUNG|nr:hypothetical protein K493DRAFT_207875 [Basidiobolus meristosporus CBS 931.73]|eukprot:ORY02714.1 hypothetical protein K493DRAFT_207875 [Basidiobolus meristosporus CBS 931.73]